MKIFLPNLKPELQKLGNQDRRYIQTASFKFDKYYRGCQAPNSVYILLFLLDEETAFEFTSTRKIDPSVQKLLRETWEDNFTLVGEQLLERIESKQSDLVPLEDPT